MSMRLARLVALVLALWGPAAAAAQTLTISAAISMKDAVTEVGRDFAAGRPGVTILYNLGSSGELQKQIEAGAPVDLFISAAALQMDEVEKRGLLVPGTRRVFARNLLTVVKPTDSRLDLAKAADLAEPRVARIVVGNPRTVPAGQYAEESLRTLRLWDRLKSRLVFGENVRQVLDYVSRDEVHVGIVYATDALTRAGQVRLAFAFPEDTHSPIVYPAAVVKSSRHRELARAFVEILAGSEGQAVLRRLGFELPGPDRR